MIDLRAARNDPEGFRAAVARKGAAEAFDALLAADEHWRALVPRADDLRGRLKLKGKPTPEQLEELNRVKEELRLVEEELAAAEAERDRLLEQVPNPPDPSAPDGDTEDDAEELRRVGEQTPEGPEHTEIGRFDGLDEAGARSVSEWLQLDPAYRAALRTLGSDDGDRAL